MTARKTVREATRTTAKRGVKKAARKTSKGKRSR
jgi:hypothetical protein